MRPGRTELMVGAFTVLSVVILSLMTFRVGEFTLGKKKGYKLYAFFENTAGLDENTSIKIAGVDSGTVERIELFAGKARVTMRLNDDVIVYSNASARIKSTGLLGDKFLEIKTGYTPPALTMGNTIKDARAAAEIDDLVKNITDLSVNITGLLSELGTPEVKTALKDTLVNLRELTAELKSTVKENRKPLGTVVANLNNLTDTLNSDMPAVLSDLKSALSRLEEVLNNTAPKAENFMDNINAITARINRGEGTLGKLVHDDKLYESISGAASGLGNIVSHMDRFKTFVSFRGDYLLRENAAKGFFNLTLQPRKERYYILGVVTDPIGTVETTTTTEGGTTTTTETVEEDKLEFTAQIAHRFNNAALRIGLTENTFGLGADYFLARDRLRFSLDAWDFGSNEYAASAPHLRVGADLFVFKTLFLSLGYDNFLNSQRTGFYAGGGVRFEDEDLKYVFGAMPAIPGN